MAGNLNNTFLFITLNNWLHWFLLSNYYKQREENCQNCDRKQSIKIDSSDLSNHICEPLLLSSTDNKSRHFRHFEEVILEQNDSFLDLFPFKTSAKYFLHVDISLKFIQPTSVDRKNLTMRIVVYCRKLQITFKFTQLIQYYSINPCSSVSVEQKDCLTNL